MRSALRRPARLTLLTALATVVSCDQSPDPVTPTRPALRSAGTDVGDVPFIDVATVEQLYEAVNDPANSPAVIRLAAGTYVLAPTDGAGVARPNGGRLDLQQDMSLLGVAGDRSAVVIDATGLPVSSLTVPSGRTGPVRVGRGDHTIESLTIVGSAAAAGGIETDLAGTASTRIRVTNVVSAGSVRGIDVRNVGTAMAGRRIDIALTGNEFAGAPGVQPSQGIRLTNMNGADGGVIAATLRANRAHDAEFGCLVSNLVTSRAVIEVRSAGDRFFENALGCFVNGGLVAGATGVANDNATTFEATGSAFVDNTQPSALGRGGILVIAGEAPNRVNGTSRNAVDVRLWGSTVARNQSPEVLLYAARSLGGAGVAGLGNRVRLELHGVSKQIEAVEIPSAPEEPGGTNTVTVIR